MSEKILTISIAAYNVEKYLPKTLESLVIPEIMDQLEVLIINDGSQDKTGQIAEEYVVKYPATFYLVNKENGGWGSTVNTSAQLATGKYYKLLDGDDFFNAEALKKFVNELETVNTDLVFTQFTKVYEPEMNEELIEQKYPYYSVFPVSTINAYSMHALTVKTEIIKSNEFHLLERCFYTDVEFCVRCFSLSESVLSLPINVYQYRLGRDEQSVSIRSMMRGVQEHDKVVREILPIVYNEKKLDNLKVDINGLAARHLNLLLCVEPNEKHWKMFQDYADLLKEEYPEVIKSLLRYQRPLLRCNKCLYCFVVKRKRKKNKFDQV